MNITWETIVITASLMVLLILVILLYIKKIVAYKNIYNKYKDVNDIDKEAAKSQTSLDKLKHDFEQLDKELIADMRMLKKERR